MERIHVDRRASARIASGHPWAYGNEIRDDLKSFTAGQIVDIADPRDRVLATGFVNPRSLIAIRVLTREGRPKFDAEFFAERLRRADALRRRFRPGAKSYRLCYGESDDLPGLVIDRFDDVYVVASHAAGIDALTEPIVGGLVRAVSPRGVLLKYDASSRALEGLSPRIEVAHGEVPQEITVEIEGNRFVLDLRAGQKTGFFHDHAPNRTWLSQWTKGARVLDVFCYVGAWSLAAARGGASSVLGIDGSEEALKQARASAKASGLADRVTFEKGDAFARLKQLEEAQETFDVVVLDPPAFVKSRKKIDEGMKGYREVNRRAFSLVKPGGILATASCSRHVDRAAFVGMLQAAADDAHRPARILAFGGQGADHPVHLRLPETEYLTCVFLEVG